MNNLKFQILLSSISLVLTGCNFSKVASTKNESAIEKASATTLGESVAPKPSQSGIEGGAANGSGSISPENMNSINSNAQLLQVMTQLESTALTPQIVDHPARRQDPLTIRAFAQYNLAMLRMVQAVKGANSQSPDKEFEAAQKKYLSFLQSGCFGKLQGCTRLTWAKNADPRTHQVLVEIADAFDKSIPNKCETKDCEASLKQLFSLISLSLITGNRNRATGIYRIFIKRIYQYVRVLEKEKDSDAIKTEGFLFEEFANNLTADEDEKIILPVIKENPPWAYSSVNNFNFNFATEKIFSVAAKHLLYEGSGGSISKSLKDFVLQNQKTETNSQSFYLVAKRISQSKDSQEILKNIGFSIDPFLDDGYYDEYFYVIDRIAFNHLNFSEALSIWNSSRKNVGRLTTKVRELAQLELINLVIKTNNYFLKMLTDEKQKTEDLFIKSVDESRPVSEMWMEYFERYKRVSTFLGLLVSGSNLSVEATKEINDTVSLIYLSRKNVKFMAVYPNMLMLGYFLIKDSVSIKTTTYFGFEIEEKPKTIVDKLLLGGFASPWFPFSTDQIPLLRSEMILALDYTLRLGIFDLFASAKNKAAESKVDYLSFFSALTSTLDEDIGASGGVTSLTESLQKFEISNHDKIKDICGRPDFKGLSRNLDIQDFEVSPLFGSNDTGEIEELTDFYDNVFKIDEKGSSGSKISTIKNRLLQLKAMRVALLSHLNSIKMNSAKIAQDMSYSQQERDLQKAKTSQIEKMEHGVNKKIDNVTEALMNFYKSALNTHRLISDCSERMLRKRRDYAFGILQNEKLFFTSVYNAMLAVGKAATPAEKDAKANEYAKQLGIEPSSLMKEQYLESKWVTFQRFARYVNSSNLGIKFNINFEVTSTIQDNLKNARKSVLFADTKSMAPVPLESFVSEAMSYYNDQGLSTVKWFNDYQLKLGTAKEKAMIALYRLGHELGVANKKVTYKGLDLNAVTVNEIINQSMAKAQLAHISVEQEALMRLIGQYTFAKNNELSDYLFDSSESDYRGVFDNAFDLLLAREDDLQLAKQFYDERLAVKSFSVLMFPMSAEVEKEVFNMHKMLADQASQIQKDVIGQLQAAELELNNPTAKGSQFELNSLQIVYRILPHSNEKMVYSPELIKSTGSVLVDRRKIAKAQNRILRFHAEETMGAFR